MKLYLIIPALFILLFVYMFVQALLYRTRHYTLPTRKGIRLLHITDIHIGLLFISSGRMKKTIARVNPDYIIISGDLFDKPSEMDKFARWFEGLDIQVPVYCVLGNHDHNFLRKYHSFRGRFESLMRELNIRILKNETVFIETKRRTNSAQKPVALIGIDDCKAGTPVKNEIFSGLSGKSDCIVAFSHNPDISLHIPPNSVDLLLAGHFHGGQLWMPFNLESLLLRKDRVSKMGYIKGFANIRKNRVYISRGLGTVLVPFRFFSVPEVTVFDI